MLKELKLVKLSSIMIALIAATGFSYNYIQESYATKLAKLENGKPSVINEIFPSWHEKIIQLDTLYKNEISRRNSELKNLQLSHDSLAGRFSFLADNGKGQYIFSETQVDAIRNELIRLDRIKRLMIAQHRILVAHEELEERIDPLLREVAKKDSTVSQLKLHKNKGEVFGNVSASILNTVLFALVGLILLTKSVLLLKNSKP